MARHGLGADAGATDVEMALRARKLLAEVEERELRLAVKKREYVAMDEVRTGWTAQVAKAKDLLRHKFELELPPVLSGLDAVLCTEQIWHLRSGAFKRSSDGPKNKFRTNSPASSSLESAGAGGDGNSCIFSRCRLAPLVGRDSIRIGSSAIRSEPRKES